MTSKSWRIHEDASAEIDATVSWYETQRSGLGLEFLAELRAAFRQLRSAPDASAPDATAPPEMRARRRRVLRFPYAIVFIDTATAYVVIAVMHLRRRPGYWLERAGDKP